jgi:RNA polymerase sigma factor (sigma-70 family)
LVQEATLRALIAFRKAQSIRKPHAFLRKVVLDTVHDYWRRRHHSEDVDSIEERFIAQQPDFELRIDNNRRREALRVALRELDPDKRETVALFYSDELSVPEIARLQSRSASAVKMELMRARRDLARIIRNIARKKAH